MKIGAVIPHHEIGTDPGALKAFAQGAEELGADHLLLYDHVLGADPDRAGGFDGPYDKDVRFREPFTTFAFLAGITEKIGFMSAVLVLPQRQTALVAKQSAEVALLSGNRLRLGIGTGWNDVEYEALNEDFRNRGRRQEEQVRVLRSLWQSESLDFDGRYHRVDRASINPRPSEPVPIWFGGGAPKLIRRCALLGDGWVPVMGPNGAAREIIDSMKSIREQAGLNWNGFGIQAQAQYAGGDPDRWFRHASRWRELGATHLAVATHNAGKTGVEGHIQRFAEYLTAITRR